MEDRGSEGGVKMATTEATKKAQKKYDKKFKQFKFRLKLDNDADIIEWLKDQPSASARIKELIRAEMES
jgi:hypothetical protein